MASADIAADPERFYAGKQGQKRVIRDLMSFTEFETLSTALMSEYILSS